MIESVVVDTTSEDFRVLAEVRHLVPALHAVPCTVDEIVRLARGLGYGIDADDVVAMLRAAGIRPRIVPFRTAEIIERATQ